MTGQDVGSVMRIISSMVVARVVNTMEPCGSFKETRLCMPVCIIALLILLYDGMRIRVCESQNARRLLYSCR